MLVHQLPTALYWSPAAMYVEQTAAYWLCSNPCGLYKPPPPPPSLPGESHGPPTALFAPLCSFKMLIRVFAWSDKLRDGIPTGDALQAGGQLSCARLILGGLAG